MFDIVEGAPQAFLIRLFFFLVLRFSCHGAMRLTLCSNSLVVIADPDRVGGGLGRLLHRALAAGWLVVMSSGFTEAFRKRQL